MLTLSVGRLKNDCHLPVVALIPHNVHGQNTEEEWKRETSGILNSSFSPGGYQWHAQATGAGIEEGVKKPLNR